MAENEKEQIDTADLLDVEQAQATITFEIPSMVGKDGSAFVRTAHISGGRAFRIYRGIVAPRPKKEKKFN